MACFLQRLSHLDIESCHRVTSLALTSGSNKLPSNAQLIFPNKEGLLGCTFLQYLNVSKCPRVTLESLDALVEKYGPSLKVHILNQYAKAILCIRFIPNSLQKLRNYFLIQLLKSFYIRSKCTVSI